MIVTRKNGKEKALIGAFAADCLFLKYSMLETTLKIKDGQILLLSVSLELLVADNESLVPIYEGDTLEITF